MSEATKSYMRCRRCENSDRVLRLQWLDVYPEGNRWYDDHVCLECGLYADQSGLSLQASSLLEYRRKYGHVVGLPPETPVQTLAANAGNDRLSDADFRKLARDLLT